MTNSRRNFIKRAALCSGAAVAGQTFFARRLMAATKASSGSYKSLVCINLDGGNDGNNLIVPMASQDYGLYTSARQQLAISQSSLLPIGDGHGGAYGLHPSLPRLQKAYAAGNAAIVANVGTLVTPNDRVSFLAQRKQSPNMLEDHEIQRQEWGTAFSTISPSALSPSGWGGRIADVMTSGSVLGFPVVTSLVGADPFTSGDTTTSATFTPGGGGSFPSDGSQSDLQLIANLNSGSQLVGASEMGLRNAMQQTHLMSSALAVASPFKTVFPSTPLGSQLQQIATIMSVRSALGMNRQIFLCKQLGYDLHAGQLAAHASLLTDLDQSVSAFMSCMTELGLMNEVTVFTQSDFGRSLAMNSGAGSDHAWGNHQIVLGGAVQGNQVYGKFPDLTLGGADDMESTGRWIPSSSIEQYAAPIASWFGVPSQSLVQVFPNMGAFALNTIPLFG